MVSPSACRVRGPAGERRVERRVMEVLVVLLRSAGTTVSRDQLIDACWGGRIVSDDAVSRAIAQVRSLGRGLDAAPLMLETIPKVGFRLILPASADEEPPPALDATNLPISVGALIGRERDHDAIGEVLASARLVTIVGGGGVGKTRFGIEAARRQQGLHEDGVWLTELAAITDPDRVPELVAKAMGIELLVGQNARATLAERLRRRRCLLILDNCEHLIDAVAELAEAILARAPGARLLLTSQEPLDISGEQVFRLAPLTQVDAEALFIERAQACDLDFVIGSDDASAVTSICQRLDGVPLAIEMAAARAPALGCAGVLQRLDDRFRVLTGGRRTAMPRQRTLLATFDWSHGLLNNRDAVVFRRLGVFVGGFSLEAATEVAADDGCDTFEVVDAVSSLVAKSLLTARTARGRTRYGLLETARAYAIEKLTAAGELEATRRRHAEWCASFAAPIWTDFISQMSDDELLSRYLPEFDNIHRALDWAHGEGGDDGLGQRLLAATISLWEDRPLKRWLDLALPRMTASTPPAVRARLIASRAHVTMRLDPTAALDIVDEAVEAVRANIADPVALCDVLASKGSALWLVGRHREGRMIADEMRALMADLPPSRIKAFSMALDASLRVAEDGWEAGAALFEATISSLRGFGADGLANYWEWMSFRLVRSTDPDAEIDTWRALLRRIRPGDMYAESVSVAVARGLGERLARRGRPRDLKEAIELAQFVLNTGVQEFDYKALLSLALVAYKSGRPDDAATIVGYANARRRELGATPHSSDLVAVWRLLSQDLDETRLATLSAAGASLSSDEVMLLAFQKPPEAPLAALRGRDIDSPPTA